MFVPIKIFHIYIVDCNCMYTVFFINFILLDTYMQIIIIVNDPWSIIIVTKQLVRYPLTLKE